MDEIDLFAKASRLFAVRINLRLKFCGTYQLNVETFPDLVKLILNDRDNVSPRHRRSWGSNRPLLACLPCFTCLPLRFMSGLGWGLVPRSCHSQG